MRIPVTKAQIAWAKDAAKRGKVLKIDLRTFRIREVKAEARK
jgi:hypothetical protein